MTLYNVEAEKIVLGSMIQENENVDDISKLLRVDDLYIPEHRKLYETMLNLNSDNIFFDILILKEYGFSLEFLTEINMSVFSKYGYNEYLTIVRDLGLRRSIVNATKEIQKKVYEENLQRDLATFKADCMECLDVKIHEDTTTAGKIANEEIIELFESLEERCVRNGKEISKKDKYGFSWLDQATAGTHKSEVTVLAARPGSGKTAFSLNIALNKIVANAHVRIFSLEMTKESLLERMLINLVGVDGLKLRAGKVDDDEFRKLLEAALEMTRKNLYIDDKTYSLDKIRGICRRAKNKGKLDYLIIDYFQLLETSFKSYSSNERFEYISRRIKLLAKELEVPILLLSQLNRAPEMRCDRTPQLSDLRGSGALEQDSDNVFFLHHLQDEDYNGKKGTTIDVVLTIAKQRSGISGKNNIMRFFTAHQRFREISYIE